jgi:hypothetical protein
MVTDKPKPAATVTVFLRSTCLGKNSLGSRSVSNMARPTEHETFQVTYFVAVRTGMCNQAYTQAIPVLANPAPLNIVHTPLTLAGSLWAAGLSQTWYAPQNRPRGSPCGQGGRGHQQTTWVLLAAPS